MWDLDDQPPPRPQVAAQCGAELRRPRKMLEDVKQGDAVERRQSQARFEQIHVVDGRVRDLRADLASLLRNLHAAGIETTSSHFLQKESMSGADVQQSAGLRQQ